MDNSFELGVYIKKNLGLLDYYFINFYINPFSTFNQFLGERYGMVIRISVHRTYIKLGNCSKRRDHTVNQFLEYLKKFMKQPGNIGPMNVMVFPVFSSQAPKYKWRTFNGTENAIKITELTIDLLKYFNHVGKIDISGTNIKGVIERLYNRLETLKRYEQIENILSKEKEKSIPKHYYIPIQP